MLLLGVASKISTNMYAVLFRMFSNNLISFLGGCIGLIKNTQIKTNGKSTPNKTREIPHSQTCLLRKGDTTKSMWFAYEFKNLFGVRETIFNFNFAYIQPNDLLQIHWSFWLVFAWAEKRRVRMSKWYIRWLKYNL